MSAKIVLRPPLSDRAGATEVEVPAATVGDALVALERDRPDLSGWILDEQRRIRRHVKAFLNGEQADEDTPVTDGDSIQILHAISGG